MNCPMHNLIYRSRGRSYRELPLRLFEFGHVYRYEKSGVVHGLTRVRGLTMDDSHSYVTPEQAPDEIKHLLNFCLEPVPRLRPRRLLPRAVDPRRLEARTSSSAPTRSGRSRPRSCEQVALESGLELVPDPGGAAFYGPKISVQARDAIGRTWQMSTDPVRLQPAARFRARVPGAPTATRQRPVMIHSAKFGSIERFIGVLTEHYAGAFPAWLSPVQVIGIPVTDEQVDYLYDVAARMQARGHPRRGRRRPTTGCRRRSARRRRRRCRSC